MQGGFYPPMVSHCMGESLYFSRQAGDENTRLHTGFLVALLAFAEHHSNTAQIFPIRVLFRQLLGYRQHVLVPLLDAAVAFFLRMMTAMRQSGHVVANAIPH